MDKNFIKIFDWLQRIESQLNLNKSILNIDEVAKLTSLSKSTIYKLTCRRGIPHFKKCKHLLFDRDEILNWLKSNRVATQQELESEASTYVTLNKRRGGANV